MRARWIERTCRANYVRVDSLSWDKGCTHDTDQEAHDGEARSIGDGNCRNKDHDATPNHHH